MSKRKRSLLAKTTVSIALLGSCGAATLAAIHPAAAASFITAVQSMVTCSTQSTGCVVGTNTNSGEGVVGTSNTGIGVWGKSQKGLGVYALSSSGTALSAVSISGLGADIQSDGPYSAIFAFNSVPGLAHPAVYGKNSAAGYGAHFDGGYGGVWGSAPGAANGYPLVATDQNQNPNTVFDVDGQGDIYYTGYVNQVARAVDGMTVHAYGTQTTLPTVEDTGTAQLVGGSATVKLDSTFSRTIDAASSYRVFVTANGDTHGLFVTSKTAGAFVVHENQGGRSTVSFDYRIVATALGHAGQRMAFTSRAALMPQFSALPPVAPMMEPAMPRLPAFHTGP